MLNSTMKMSLSFLISLMMLTACHTVKNTEPSTNSIFFVVLRISKDKEQRKSAIEFVSKTKSLGEIKEIPQGQIDAENFLTIELFEGAKRVKTIFMPHPLYKRIEYFDGNKLATKYVELEKEEFFIRFQMSVGSSNKVRISETLNGLKSTKLTVIKL